MIQTPIPLTMNDRLLFVVLVIICIITHIIRSIYEILKHRKIITANKISFIIVFTNMMLLWASWFGLCSLDPNRLDIPDVWRYIGLGLAVTGVFAFITALLTIKALESYDGDLITRGIYSITRHPMYSAFILWLIGLPLYYGGLNSIVLCIMFVMNVLFWRHLEEKELITRFAGYTDYRKKTIF